MNEVTYERFNANVRKWIERLKAEGRYCPFGCKNEGKELICVGRAGAHTNRIVAVDVIGLPNDIMPSRVNHLDDCPVVRDPNSSIIE